MNNSVIVKYIKENSKHIIMGESIEVSESVRDVYEAFNKSSYPDDKYVNMIDENKELYNKFKQYGALKSITLYPEERNIIGGKVNHLINKLDFDVLRESLFFLITTEQITEKKSSFLYTPNCLSYIPIKIPNLEAESYLGDFLTAMEEVSLLTLYRCKMQDSKSSFYKDGKVQASQKINTRMIF